MTESNSVESNTIRSMDAFARVKRLEGTVAVIAMEADCGGCGRCSEPGGCRSGLLSRPFRAPSREFSLHNEIGAGAGDRVRIHLATGELARWSLTTYLVPVFAVVIGAAIGASIAGELYSRDSGAVGGSLVGLLLAVGLIAARHARASVVTVPRMVRMSDDIPTCRREERP